MAHPMAATRSRQLPSVAALPLERIIIAEDRCKGCELCIQACAPQVLALDRSRVNALGYNPIRAVAIERCTSCALCARVCPDCVFTVYAPAKAVR
jgi:2-oxoglutarate ferredoxin oxidoreductase subunit delta